MAVVRNNPFCVGSNVAVDKFIVIGVGRNQFPSVKRRYKLGVWYTKKG